MQDTRFNTLISRTGDRLNEWLQNPWRRWSVIIISLLFGFYLGTAISTIAGQRAILDVAVAAVVVGFTELVSILAYRRLTGKRAFIVDSLNAVKIGLIYNMTVEAFKLGS